VDEKGSLYLAAKNIFVYSPEGKQISQIEVPEPPSNLAFGDADLETIYVTARTSLFRLRLMTAGSVQN
jgi:gluconolactonase